MSAGKLRCERCTDVIDHTSSTPSNSKASPKKRAESYCSDCSSDIRKSTKLWSNPSDEKVPKDTALTDVPENVKTLYSVYRRHSGQLGGDLYGGEIYGEMTMGSFQRIVDFMVKNCNFGADSVFLDIGSGLGKPNAHVAVSPGVRYSLGLELMDLRWQLSLHNLRYVLKESALAEEEKCTIFYAKADACQLKTFDPCTHLYMFDVGFVRETLNRLAKVFNQSPKAQYLVSTKKPRDIIFEYGFLVKHIGSLSISMTGSNESHAVYIYEAIHKLKRPTPKLVVPPVVLDASSTTTEESESGVASPKKRPSTSAINAQLKSPRKPQRGTSQSVPSVLVDGVSKMNKLSQTEYLHWIDESLNATLFKEGTQTRSRATGVSKRRKLFE